MKKKLLALLLATAIVTAAAGCGSEPANGSSSETNSGETGGQATHPRTIRAAIPHPVILHRSRKAPRRKHRSPLMISAAGR